MVRTMSSAQPLVLQLVKTFPSSPGVYLMKDARGKVIYVGKAAHLRDRVRSYFGGPWSLTPKTIKLVEHVADVEYIVTDSAAEALMLEGNLIKEHKPHYNVRLKDDKHYPYLKINVHEPWPQVFITRRVANDGARYFGPYANSGSVRQTLALVKKLFPYRSCNKLITGNDPRPCLDFHIHRCLGPCIGAVNEEEYGKVVQQVTQFLEGKQELVVKDLKQQMLSAADSLDFERAARLRDQLRAVERVIERQKAISVRGEDQDAIAIAQDGTECCALVFMVRNGKIVGREHFMLEGAQDEEPSVVMSSFLLQHYADSPHIPAVLLLQHSPDDRDAIAAWLSQQRGGRVEVRLPVRGEKKQLVNLAAENARQTLQQVRVKWLTDLGKTAAALTELQDILDLPRLPQRMECYDISNISGTAAVGSMVVFEDGKAKSAEYRRFRIKNVAGIDDYGMMQEVIRRRFKRAQKFAEVTLPEEDAAQESPDSTDEELPSELSPRKSSWGVLPDLVILDGGKGHLHAVLETMRELGVHTIPTCSLAKQQEEVFLPHVAESVMLPADSQGLYLLQRIRDEAHRFAITYHRNLRSAAAVTSPLDVVSGVGPKRKKALLRHFGSLKNLRDASLEEILAVKGMTHSLAEKIKFAV